MAFIGDENAGCALAFLRLERMRAVQRRRHFKQSTTLKDRLVAEASQCREQARLLPPGPVREAILFWAQQADAAAHIDEWLRSRGLRPPP
jgi:hypothetical protein